MCVVYTDVVVVSMAVAVRTIDALWIATIRDSHTCDVYTVTPMGLGGQWCVSLIVVSSCGGSGCSYY